MDMIDKNGLKISSTLFDFVNNEAIPGTKVDPKEFWINFSKFAHELAPINKRLINYAIIIISYNYKPDKKYYLQ